MILPQLILEAGFAPTSPVGAALTFQLDSATAGVLDTDILGNAVATWTDISRFVQSFTITRASTRQQGPLLTVQASTLSCVLDNSDGRFDPDNLAGPYVSGGVTQIRPMIPVRVTAVFGGVTYPLFSGFADGWQDSNQTYSAGYDEVTLSATDAFKVLAGITLPTVAAAGAGEDAGARITRILNSSPWYTDHRVIATGDTTLQATTYGDTVLNLMQLTSDSEIGELYIDGLGRVVFRHRRAVLGETRSTTPQGVFGDLDGTTHPAGTELAFASVGRADDDTTMANDVQATNANIGTLQEVQDTNSIATFLFPRSYARSDLILTTDSAANYWAQGILQVSKHDEDRFGTLTVDPQADVVNLWQQVLGRDYGDRIQVWRRPLNAGIFLSVTAEGGNAGTAATTIACPVTAAAAAGNTVIGVVKGSSSDAVSSVTDTQGNTWVIDSTVSAVGPTGAIVRSNITAPLTTSDTITVTFAGANNDNGAIFCAYQGTLLLDFNFSTFWASATTGTVTSPTGTANPAELVVMGAGTGGVSSQTFTWSATTPPVVVRGTNNATPFVVTMADGPAAAAGTAPGFTVSYTASQIGVGLVAAYSSLTITKDVLVRGITHTYDAVGGNTWSTTWTLQDAARFTGFLILDSVTQGVLDTNKLAY